MNMQKMFEKIMIVLAAVGFAACTADVATQQSLGVAENPSMKVQTSEGVFVGGLFGDEVLCAVELDRFSDALWAKSGTHVAEQLEILDSNGVAELHMVLFNVIDEATEAYWFLLVKEDCRYFYVADVAASNLNVYCKAATGCAQGCYRQYDKHRNFIACRCLKPRKKRCDEVPIPKSFLGTIQDALSCAL